MQCTFTGGGAFLANAMLLRGDLSVSDVNTVMAKLQPSLNMVHFNADGESVNDLYLHFYLPSLHVVLEVQLFFEYYICFSSMHVEVWFPEIGVTHHF